MSMTIRERQKECNTLVSLLSGTVGHNVIVELRNETTVAGKLNNVEPITMNLSLSDVTFIGTDEVTIDFDCFYVQGKNIRYVQIPDEIDMLATIKSQLDKIQSVRKIVTQRKAKLPSQAERKRRQREYLERKKQELMEKLGMNNPGSSDVKPRE